MYSREPWGLMLQHQPPFLLPVSGVRGVTVWGCHVGGLVVVVGTHTPDPLFLGFGVKENGHGLLAGDTQTSRWWASVDR